MKQYDFDKLIDRKQTACVKWDGMPGLLPLWVADMDFPVAEPVVRALQERIAHPIFGYSMFEASGCKAAATGWFRRRFGWKINPNELFFCPGVVPALSFLIQMLTREGDGIVIQTPVYHPFAGKIRENGRRVVENPLICEDGQYRMDFADLENKLADAQGIILCSPHNPVGRVWMPDELCRVVEICRRLDKWIISDEIHCDILRAGVTHHPLLKLCAVDRDRIIACTAPTKTFNLAGIQYSNVIIPNPIYQEKWKAIVSRMGILDASPFAIAAATAAYEQGDEWLDAVNAYIDANLSFAVSYLKEHLPKVRVQMPEGTYLLWPYFGDYCADPEQLDRLIAEKAGIALNAGYIFGKNGEGFERVNVACPRALLANALEQICHLLQVL